MRAGGKACIALLAFTLPVSAAQASFPGRNGKLAVAVEGCGGADSLDDPRHIHAFSPRGRDLGRLTQCDGVDRYAPHWLADGERLALAERPADMTRLTTRAADGSNPAEIPVEVGGNEYEGEPTVSPDGRHVAWSEDGAIYRAAVDGTGLRRLRGPSKEDGPGAREPSWSPDGRKIAYSWDRNLTREEIWLMDARTGERTRRLARNGREPDWSPDGKRVVYRTSFNRFSAEENGDLKGANLWVVRADGTGHRRVHRTHGVAATEPVWSPNGRSIAWIELDFGPGDVSPDIRPTIRRMRLRGGTPRRLAELQQAYIEGDDYRTPALSWQPLP
jgi:Tol biopolymer transport system component